MACSHKEKWQETEEHRKQENEEKKNIEDGNRNMNP